MGRKRIYPGELDLLEYQLYQAIFRMVELRGRLNTESFIKTTLEEEDSTRTVSFASADAQGEG